MEGVEQLRGKLLKDKGDFSEFAAGLRHYLDTIIISDPQNEGWATGDCGQVLMEKGTDRPRRREILGTIEGTTDLLQPR